MRLSWICPLVALAVTPLSASAAVLWTGDVETGDLSQFDSVLNGTINGTDYATAAQDITLEGQYAVRIELHNDAIWPGNMLRRVEVHHSPDPSRTAEGATTCLGWSLYLPEALPADPGHSLGYWESNNSYQQMMAFNANGQNLRFITQQPNYTEHWSADGVLTPGEWHRIAMCVLWSEDPGVGTVDVWFDGEQVVTAASAKTLADGNAHFAQMGLLRSNVDIPEVPVIYLDYVLEGDTIEDVDPPLDPGGSDSGGGDTAGADSTGGPAGDTGDTGVTSAATDGGGGSVSAGDGSGGVATTDAGSGSSGPDASDGGDDSGCSCRSPAAPSTAAAWWLLPLAFGLRRRRRRHG
jgi:MYXO-CTERM domain-containing protein